MRNQNAQPEMTNECFSRACAKLRLVQDYLNMCDFYKNGDVPLAYEVASVVEDAVKELNAVASYVPEVRMGRP